MKKLVLFMFFSHVANIGHASFTLISNEKCGGVDGCTTTAIDTSGADLLVVHYASVSGPPSSVSDSKGNTWTALTAQTGNGKYSRIYYSWNPSVGTNHTFTVSAAASFPLFTVQAFSGSNTSSDPFFAENSNTSGAVSSLNTNSVTVNATGDLVVSGISQGGGSQTMTSDYTISDQSPLVGGTNYGGGMSYKLSGTGSESSTWGNLDNSFGSYSTVIATFKQSSGGATTPVCPSPFCGILQ